MTETSTLSKISNEIQKAERIGLMGHKRPDGDSAGSLFALYKTLQLLGKKPVIFSGEGAESFSYLTEFLEPDYSNTPIPVDLIIFVDMASTAQESVLGLVGFARDNRIPTILIDHHFSGDIKDLVDISLIDYTLSSAAELVFDVINFLKVPVDKAIATFLYAGVVTDSGSFQYQNTSKRTLEIGSELIKRGAKKEKIIEDTFYKHTPEKLRLWGLAMERLYYNEKYKVAITYVTYKDLDNLGLKTFSASSLANYLNMIKGTKAVVVVAEEPKGKLKVSMRSNDPVADLTKIARLFGGGGHIKASAFMVDGSIEETKDGIRIV